MRKVALLALMVLVVVLAAAGCASTGSDRMTVDTGGTYQIRYTTFHGGTR